MYIYHSKYFNPLPTLSQSTCDLDAKNVHAGLTALHIATQRGYSRILEYLVGYGADVNTVDYVGMTILHMVVSGKNMNQPLSRGETPQLEKVSKAIFTGNIMHRAYVW